MKWVYLQKIITMRMLVMLLLATMSAFAQKDPVIKSVTVKTAIYCDHCVQCETCGGHFNKKLLRTKGVQMVTLDAEAMTIKVVYNSKKTDEHQIREAISKLGYDADSVKADANAYAALDACCHKS